MQANIPHLVRERLITKVYEELVENFSISSVQRLSILENDEFFKLVTALAPNIVPLTRRILVDCLCARYSQMKDRMLGELTRLNTLLLQRTAWSLSKGNISTQCFIYFCANFVRFGHAGTQIGYTVLSEGARPDDLPENSWGAGKHLLEFKTQYKVVKGITHNGIYFLKAFR